MSHNGTSNTTNDEISRIVKLWIDGNIRVNYMHNISSQSINDMNNMKKIYYNLILDELKKQMRTDDINTIEIKLGGSLQVFFDETGIVGSIINDSSDDYYGDDYDD
jgi:hypothetical protein